MTDIGLSLRRITLLTDFGTRDGYAAAMRAVIAGIAPDASVEDASHDIPPGDVHAAAWALAMYALMYPPGSIHLAIIDPGVGSSRRAIAARSGGQIFIAPDNGVLSRVLEPDSEIVEIQERAYRRDSVSPTFHGRDIFAPAAAHVARGIALDQLGPRAVGVVRLDLPQPTRIAPRSEEGMGAGQDVVIEGVVIHVDRFGNLITNIPTAMMPVLDESHRESHTVEVMVAGRVAIVGKSYSAVESGALLAYIGSSSALEIAVRDGNAADVTGMQRGARVTVRHTSAAKNGT